MLRISLVFVLLAAALSPAASGQAPPARAESAEPAPLPGRDWHAHGARTPPVEIRDVSFQSKSLARPMKYRVALPADYAHGSRRYAVLYLLHGLGGSYLDWGDRTHLADLLARVPLIVIMPDAGDSWYTNSSGVAQDKFEDYIAEDMVEETDSRYRTLADRHGRAIAGLSMGGYGALKIALKHPDEFMFAGSLSGAFGVAHDPAFGSDFSTRDERRIQSIFGPAGSATRAGNDIYALARNAEPVRLPALWLACGTEDHLLPRNRELVRDLQRRGVRYEYSEWPGAHTWLFWDQGLRRMLPVLMRDLAEER